MQELEAGERPVLCIYVCLPNYVSCMTCVLATSLCALSSTGPLPHSLHMMDLL